MTPLKDVLGYAVEGDKLTKENIAAIAASPLAEVSAEEIIRMNAIGLAERMKQEKLFVEDNAGRLKIAKAILALIVDSGIIASSPVAAPVPAIPQKIEVTVPKSPDQMTAVELLKQLAGNPQDIEALTLLRTKEPIASASRITDEWAIRKDGVLSAELTLAYCLYLGKTGARTQRQYKGGRPTTIENAMGIKEKALRHPLIEGDIIQEGMDSYGNDWTNVPRELMKALLWARVTGHQRFPRTFDPTSVFYEISATPLSPRWAGILSDYQAAVADEEPGTEINLTWNEKKAARDPKAKPGNEPARMKNEAEEQQGRPTKRDFEELKEGLGGLVGILSGAGGKSDGKEESAENYVRARLQGNAQSSGVDSTITGVFSNIVIGGVNCKFMAIALNTVKVSGVGASGIIYTGPEASVKITGVGMTVQQKSRSWEQLKEIIDNEF